MRQILLPVLVSTCLLPLAAADLDREAGAWHEHHLRVTVQSLPKQLHSELSASGAATGSSSTDADAESAGRLGVGYAYTSPHKIGLLLGGGFDFSSITFKDSGNETKLEESGIHIEPGVSWRVVDGFSLETGLLLGIGRGKTTSSVPGLSIDDTAYAEVSPRLRGVYVFDGGFELLAEVGYHYQRFTYEYSTLGVNITAKETLSGGYAGLGLGWAF